MSDQQKHDLKSMLQYFPVILWAYYKDSNMHLHKQVYNKISACYSLRDVQSISIQKIKNIKITI